MPPYSFPWLMTSHQGPRGAFSLFHWKALPLGVPVKDRCWWRTPGTASSEPLLVFLWVAFVHSHIGVKGVGDVGELVKSPEL